MARPRRLLTKAEIAEAFQGEDANEYGPILTTEKAAQLICMSKKKLSEWKNKGWLDGTFRKRGKVLYFRDKLVDRIFNGPEWENEQQK